MTGIIHEPHATVTLTLKATAGMRLLPSEQRRAILDAVVAYFSDKRQVPFAFDAKTGAQVITGEEEGLYGWLSVNILEARLSTGKRLETSVVLDLGNASTQIAFQTERPPLDEAYTASINGTRYNLYAYSYLGLG
ncbi:nucleoside phosphatase GDA1/CD39, partial [Syncephalis pseudoplumigaleata]